MLSSTTDSPVKPAPSMRIASIDRATVLDADTFPNTYADPYAETTGGAPTVESIATDTLQSPSVKHGVGFSVLELVRSLTDATLAAASLFAVSAFSGHAIGSAETLLAAIAFLMLYDGRRAIGMARTQVIGIVLRRWGLSVLSLAGLGLITGYLRAFDPQVLFAWIVVTPIAQIVAHLAAPWVYRPIIRMTGVKRSIVVGDNRLGRDFAKTINGDPFACNEVVGFFDDRDKRRRGADGNEALLGTLSDVGDYARREGIDQIFIALPIAAQPRILKMIRELHDTTASIWFVADLARFQPVQASISTMGGFPVVAICESPFRGVQGSVKRVFDIVVSLTAIILTAPVMLAIALAIRMTSPGPVIFKQRRYGLDGREIRVYKFRSMTTTEDGVTTFKAAERGDSRITPVGAFIRRTSLDELPQFFNVLQGRMSVVGPRPLALLVNTHYRSRIPSYMLRHKVRPGITGWAQVNGFRGGDDLPKMTRRIEFDLEYLRKWSLWLDIKIVLRTVRVMFKDPAAF